MWLLGKEVGENPPNEKPVYIAEISQNYADIEEACALIRAAKRYGADAVKLQIIIPDDLTINSDAPDFICKAGQWKGRKLYDLYKDNSADYPVLMDYAKKIGIKAFPSVYGERSIKVAGKFRKPPAIKIASFENNWPEIYNKAYYAGSCIIVSSGLYDINGESRLSEATVVMHCISSYPCPQENAYLSFINKLKYDKGYSYVGYSDHTIGSRTAEMAVTLGACCIEKHITLRKDTVDGSFSANPEEFGLMVRDCNATHDILYKGVQKAEDDCLQYKRSIYVVKDIKKGDKFTEDNIRVIRPGYGAKPILYSDLIVGKAIAKADLEAATPLKEENIVYTEEVKSKKVKGKAKTCQTELAQAENPILQVQPITWQEAAVQALEEAAARPPRLRRPRT